MAAADGYRVIVSLGLDSSLWEEARRWAPELDAVRVDVRPFLPAPPRGRRPQGNHRTPAVIALILASPRFLAARAAVDDVLYTSSIVLVGCSGGRHRAPVVAEYAHTRAMRIHATPAREVASILGILDLIRRLSVSA